jgi:hypothetical protein
MTEENYDNFPKYVASNQAAEDMSAKINQLIFVNV